MEALAVNVTRFTTVQTVFAMLSSLIRPDYNVALSIMGLHGALIKRKDVLVFYFVLSAISIVLDIAWCSLFGPSAVESSQKFVLAMSSINLIIKFLSMPFVYKLHESLPEHSTFAGGLGIPGTLLPSFQMHGGGSSLQSQPYQPL